MRAVLLLFRFLRTILIITISVGLCNGNLGVPCKESERQALLLFQKDLEDPSNRLSSCVGEGVCCNWTGVVCDDLTGHVASSTSLNLTLNRISTHLGIHMALLLGWVYLGLRGYKLKVENLQWVSGLSHLKNLT
ncbi:LRR receptor-like serine/threonine-protein kinase GSO1 [Prunus yedoensis var. nudiflora]|uniref:LRR receptor-like serine/threonine-protein kinase GSO1 n=1 Tax=Prunus yedoensis var. nudiflora TaxID=2094558 RepID=A0A314UNJ5_PRUYE|nr:LRR receptor-like serine/threonine-protein kinase GSO1 [Prunus yedoensis var. nudiflora]